MAANFEFVFSGVAEWIPTPQGSSRSVLEYLFLDKARDNDWQVVKVFVEKGAVCLNAQPSGRFSALHQASEAMMRFVCECVCVFACARAMCVCVCAYICFV